MKKSSKVLEVLKGLEQEAAAKYFEASFAIYKDGKVVAEEEDATAAYEKAVELQAESVEAYLPDYYPADDEPADAGVIGRVRLDVDAAYQKPADALKAVGVSGVLSAGLTWHVIGQGLAWAAFDKPADAVKYTMAKRGKGRDFAVMTFTPGEAFSGVVYLTSVKRGLDAGQVVSEGQLLDLYYGQEAKKAVKASQEKPVKAATKKPVKDTGLTVVTLDHKKLHIKPAAEKPVQPQPVSLQFGPGLVSDKEGKITIASLLHAGKVFASRTVPAEFSARFKKYSDDNRLLLYVQGGPDLGPVSTYRGWLKQGRQVSKGQHGLKILAPRMAEKEDGTKAIDGLRIVTLFSVEQTEEASQEA